MKVPCETVGQIASPETGRTATTGGRDPGSQPPSGYSCLPTPAAKGARFAQADHERRPVTLKQASQLRLHVTVTWGALLKH